MSKTEIHSGSWAKSILKVGKWYVLASLFVKGINAFTLPIFTHYMSPAELGIYSSLNSLKVFLPLLISLGLDGAFIRFFHTYKNDKNQLAKMFSSTFWFVAVFGLLCCLIIFSYCQFKYIQYDIIDIALVVFPPIFFQLGVLGISFFNQSLEAYKTTLFQIIATLIGVSFSIYLVMHNHLGVRGRLIGDSIIGFCLMFLVVFYFFKAGILKFTFDKSYIKKALIFSLPLMPASFSAWINTQSSLVLMQKFYPGQSVVGLFSLGLSIASLMYFAIDAITQVLSPVVMSGLINDRERTHQKVRELMLLFTVVILFLHLCITFFSKEMVMFFTANANAFQNAHLFIAPLCMPYLFSIYHRLFNTIISFHEKTIYITYAVLTCAFIIFISNYILLPIYGPQIAAASQILGSLAMTSIEFYYARKMEKMNLGISRYLKFILIYLVAIVLFYLLLNTSGFSIIEFIIKICILAAIAILFIYLGNYWQALKNLLKRNLIKKHA